MHKRATYAMFIVGLATLLLGALRLTLYTRATEVKAGDATRLSITIGTTDMITSLDPAQSYNFHDWEIFYNTNSGLLTYVPGTTQLIPGLAITMPEVSPDGLMYTFTLRPNLQFPDGTPLDADIVKWSIDRVSALEGAPSWLVTVFISEVQVINDTTIRFVLKQPCAFFPLLTTLAPYYPVNPNCFPGNHFAPDNTCGGIGPYTIIGWTKGVSMELKANPNYYGPSPQTPYITIKYFDSAVEMRQALENGEIDVAWRTLTPADYQALKANPDFKVIEGSGPFIRYLCFNTSASPFDEVNVRKAIAAAVERQSIAHNVFSDTMSALYSMVPIGVWSHRDSFLDSYGERNLNQARTLLRQAGYSETNKLMMDLWYPLEHYGPLEPDFAEALAAEIEETGMVSVTLHSAEWLTYINLIGKMPAFLLGWYPDYLDPDDYTFPFAHSTASADMGIFYDNPQMDELLERGQTITPIQGPEREAVYVQIQELWAEEVPTIPLLQGKLTAVTRKEVHNLIISPTGLLPYFTICRYRVYLPLLVHNYP